MESESAIEWVNKNKIDILKIAAKYLEITPYTDDDFLSAAYETALVTLISIKGTNEPFNESFWKRYEVVLANFVPYPIC
jgi:hypothetical protein